DAVVLADGQAVDARIDREGLAVLVDQLDALGLAHGAARVVGEHPVARAPRRPGAPAHPAVVVLVARRGAPGPAARDEEPGLGLAYAHAAGRGASRDVTGLTGAVAAQR